jgi:peptidoglycan/xylan/chitin deacetylase (PgdA/CDA1 family)
VIAAGQQVRRAVAAAAHGSGLLGQYLDTVLEDKALVLMYHRVLDDAADTRGIDPGMFVRRQSLASQLALLAERYTLVTIDAIGDWLAGRATFDRPPCALTFDDGWLDNYTIAFPLLQRFGATATIFLVTGAVGTADTVTWAQVDEMERAGIRFGSHTVHHVELGRCGADHIRSELVDSRATLSDRLAHPSRWFCFPKGSHSDLACQIVAEYYDGAVLVESGWVSRGDDAYRLRRIGVHDDVTRTPSLFAWRLARLR